LVGATTSHGFGEHETVSVRVPAEHDLDPDRVYPLLHVGRHVDPLARELVQSPTPPFVGASETSQGFAEHVAAVNDPALHDDVPDTVYPELHVGRHVDPLARELVQSPTPPFVRASETSQGFPVQLLGGPSTDAPLLWVYLWNHAEVPENMLLVDAEGFVDQPVMSAAKLRAFVNIAFISKTCPTFQSDMSALNSYASINIAYMFVTEPVFHDEISWLKPPGLDAFANMPLIEVTLPTSQPDKSALNG
jgi:hypothetical protein